MEPKRVISLLPSATELIDAVLRAAEADGAPGQPPAAIVVGRSHECDWPERFASLPMLTASRIKYTTAADVDRQVREELSAGNGLYSVDRELLAELRPDVIVTQSLCKVCSVDYCLVASVAEGLSPKPTVVDTNPQSLDDVLNDLRRVGKALGLESAGNAAAEALQCRIDAAAERAVAALSKKSSSLSPPPKPTIGFCEWTDPIFCGGHWTPQIIELAGATHPLNPCRGPGHGAGPSFTIPFDQFASLDPDYIIVALCGINLEDTRTREMAALEAKVPGWKELTAVRNGHVLLVDGNHMFNRPGPRLVDALEWLVAVVADETWPSTFPAERYQLPK